MDNVADILTKPITAQDLWDDLYGQMMGEVPTRAILAYENVEKEDHETSSADRQETELP